MSVAALAGKILEYDALSESTKGRGDSTAVLLGYCPDGRFHWPAQFRKDLKIYGEYSSTLRLIPV